MRVDLYEATRPNIIIGGGGGDGFVAPQDGDLVWRNGLPGSKFATGLDLNVIRGITVAPGTGVFGDTVQQPHPLQSSSDGGGLLTDSTTKGEWQTISAVCWADFISLPAAEAGHGLMMKAVAFAWTAPFIDWVVYVMNDGSLVLGLRLTMGGPFVLQTNSGLVTLGRHLIGWWCDGTNAGINIDGAAAGGAGSYPIGGTIAYSHGPYFFGGLPIDYGASYSPASGLSDIRVVNRAMTVGDFHAMWTAKRTPAP